MSNFLTKISCTLILTSTTKLDFYFQICSFFTKYFFVMLDLIFHKILHFEISLLKIYTRFCFLKMIISSNLIEFSHSYCSVTIFGNILSWKMKWNLLIPFQFQIVPKDTNQSEKGNDFEMGWLLQWECSIWEFSPQKHFVLVSCN